METEGIRFEILAETKGLDAALNKIEQSTDGLAKKLNTGFNLLDARIGLLRKNFAAVEAQIEKTGNFFGEFIKDIGEIFNIGALNSKGFPQRQRGALEPRSPREVQLASSEGTNSSGRGFAETQSTALETITQKSEETRNSLRNLDSAARDLGFTFASSFEDAVVEGRRLSDVLQGLEQDILRILTRKLVTEPLAGAVTGLIGSGLGVLSGEFHGGGRVGSASVSDRVVPASLFAGAPHFAGGGLVGRVPRLAPGEVPAILHRGEVVRTPAQEAALRRSGGGGDTQIVVNIQTPNPRAFNESRGQIQAMLADAVGAGRRNR